LSQRLSSPNAASRTSQSFLSIQTARKIDTDQYLIKKELG